MKEEEPVEKTPSLCEGCMNALWREFRDGEEKHVECHCMLVGEDVEDVVSCGAFAPAELEKKKTWKRRASGAFLSHLGRRRMNAANFSEKVPKKAGMYWVRDKKTDAVFPMVLRRTGKDAAWFRIGSDIPEDPRALDGSYEFAEMRPPFSGCAKKAGDEEFVYKK